MPKAGMIKVRLQPFQAVPIAEWLKHRPSSLLDFWSEPYGRNANAHHAQLIRRLQAFAIRKRRGGALAPVTFEITRDEATRLAGHVRKGMFGGGRRYPLPYAVEDLCWQASAALRANRGRPKLNGDALDAAIFRQNRFVSDPIQPGDPRWLKRLRKKKRSNEEFAELIEGGLLGFMRPRNSP